MLCGRLVLCTESKLVLILLLLFFHSKFFLRFIIIIYYILTHSRFEPYVFEAGVWPPNASYEQTNIFLLSCAAAVIGAIVFAKGAPYRTPIFKNGK